MGKETLLELKQLSLKLIEKTADGEVFKHLVKMLQDITDRLQPYERKLDVALFQEKAASLTLADEDIDNFIIHLIHAQNC